MKAHEIAEIVKLLRENTKSLEEQIPMLEHLTTRDVDHTGMVILHCSLADIYYKTHDYDKFIESCENAKDYAGVFVTNPYILSWYKDTLLLQAEHYAYNENFSSAQQTIEQIIRMLQMHEADKSEFLQVQGRFIELIEVYKRLQLLKYRTLWDMMSVEDREGITPLHLQDQQLADQIRSEFLTNLEKG